MSTTEKVGQADSSTTAESVERINRQRHLAYIRSSFPFDPHKHKWVYGFWFKTRHMRLLAEKHNLDWQRNCLRLSFKIADYVTRKSGVYYSLRAATYKRESALIVTFVESDNNRSLDGNEFSEKQMDRVRKAMGLPKGTKPRWFDICGRLYDEGPEESKDEDLPVKLPVKPLRR